MTRVVLGFAVVVVFSVSAAAAPGPQAQPGPGYHEVTLPTEAGPGEAVESKVVLDTPHVKLVTIVLRQGATLAEHSAPMQVSIQALKGGGTGKLHGGQTMRLEAGKMLVLAPNLAHGIVADDKADLILLIHHMKNTGRGIK